MESAADGALVVEVELTEAAEDVVIALDELVGGLDGNVEQCFGAPSLALSNAGGGEAFRVRAVPFDSAQGGALGTRAKFGSLSRDWTSPG